MQLFWNLSTNSLRCRKPGSGNESTWYLLYYLGLGSYVASWIMVVSTEWQFANASFEYTYVRTLESFGPVSGILENIMPRVVSPGSDNV